MLYVGGVLDSSYKRRIVFTDTVTAGIMNHPRVQSLDQTKGDAMDQRARQTVPWVSVCQRLIDEVPQGSVTPTMEVYSGAHHAFDDETQRWTYLGAVFNPHKRIQSGATVAYDHAAHQASIGHVRQFVQKHLAASKPAN